MKKGLVRVGFVVSALNALIQLVTLVLIIFNDTWYRSLSGNPFRHFENSLVCFILIVCFSGIQGGSFSFLWLYCREILLKRKAKGKRFWFAILLLICYGIVFLGLILIDKLRK